MLIPSLCREDEGRQAVFRAIATTEGLEAAFFFSTDEAVEAHQAFLPSPDQLEGLRAGFLGQVRDGVYTQHVLHPASPVARPVSPFSRAVDTHDRPATHS